MAERLSILPLHELHIYATVTRLQARNGAAHSSATSSNSTGAGGGNTNVTTNIGGISIADGISITTATTSSSSSSKKKAKWGKPVTVLDVLRELDHLTGVRTLMLTCVHE